VPLAEFYYCSFIDGNIFMMLPIILLGLFIPFVLLGSTADNYLTPALEKLSKRFHFSETLAGVTLLAFANGAPDVLSSFSASSGNSQGIYLSLGAVFGAGLFVTTVVFARII
jgi:sodium/potassium/calcium exchanger 6